MSITLEHRCSSNSLLLELIVTNKLNDNNYYCSTFSRYVRDTIFQYNIHCQSDCVCVDNKVSDWLFVVSV